MQQGITACGIETSLYPGSTKMVCSSSMLQQGITACGIETFVVDVIFPKYFLGCNRALPLAVLKLIVINFIHVFVVFAPRCNRALPLAVLKLPNLIYSFNIFSKNLCCNRALPLAVLKLRHLCLLHIVFAALYSSRCNRALPLAVLKRIRHEHGFHVYRCVATGHYRLRY